MSQTATPQSLPQSQPPSQPQPDFFASMPTFPTLREYIQAAASGSRDSLFHLFLAVFAFTRGTVLRLAGHYDANPRQRTFETYARLKYCLERLKAIFHTLRHAPERFFTPGQFRALIRCRAILSQLLREPVDFSPLWPWLSSPENCPPPPRSASSTGILPASESPHAAQPSELHNSELTGPLPAESGETLHAPHSALRPSSDPLLLRSPGCALASVLVQLAAIYGISNAPIPAAPSAPNATSAQPASATSPHVDPRPVISNPATDSLAQQSASHMAARDQQSPLRPPP